MSFKMFFSGGVAVENKMKDTLKEYRNRFEEVEEAWREERKDLMRKSALVDEKEARLSRQITTAVALTVEELVKRGKLVCLEEVFSKNLSSDPVFQSTVEDVVLRQLCQYDKLLKSVEKKCVEVVNETLEEIFQ